MVQWGVAVLLGVMATATAHATGTVVRSQFGGIWHFPPPVLISNSKCEHYDHSLCNGNELHNGYFKQVFITSSGFADSERDVFFSEFDRIIDFMTNAGSVWSTQYKTRILFVAYFVPGGPINDPSAAFGGKVARHPIRGYALSLSQQAVYDKIAQIAAGEISGLQPFSAGVLFNTFQTPVTANAAPPSFVQRPFGVCKFTRADLNERGSYITTHELAHAGLNYLDEYVEPGFQNLSIRQLDVMTPLALFDWTWGGFVQAIGDLFGKYDYNVSEILAANGNDNIALGAYPSTVATWGYAPEYFQWQGGMFFGAGTYHMGPDDLMNDNTRVLGPGDGFGWAHTPAQQRVLDQAFNGGAPRPNDRIRNAGPTTWKNVFGDSTHVMLYDGDKNHHFQPTQSYTVQVGWYDREWHTCWAGFIPYPCYNDVWKTAQQTFAPQARSINVKLSSLFGLAELAQDVVCAAGVNEIPTSSGGNIRLCDQDLSTMADAFLPTINFPVPYQDVEVPASQWWTTYWWRFSTWNGTWQSGWTGWSSFYRSL
jgi:hypothetical protein